MYLSRLTLNPRSAQVRSELARPYEMHRTLSHAFEQGSFNTRRADAESSGVLFRVDDQPHNNTLVVLVQSRITPDWSHLNGRLDLRRQPYLLRPVEVKAVELSLTTNQMLAFRLRANPTKCRIDNGKRVGIYAEEQQIAWLQRKAEASGFRVVRVQISRDERLTDEIHRADQPPRKLKLLTVQFDGVLQVLEPTRVQQTIECGLGSGKGFGCGLLSIARA